MKFVKLYCEKHKKEWWVATDKIVSVVAVGNISIGGLSLVEIAGDYYHDDRPPEELVAAIEEATK